MSTKTETKKGNESTKAKFAITTKQLESIASNWLKQGDSVYHVGKILFETKAKETADYDLIARKLLANNSLMGRLKTNSDGTTEYTAISGTTLKNYHRIYEFFMVKHLESFCRVPKDATLASKRQDAKKAFVNLASTQLTVLIRFVTMKESANKQVSSRVTATAHTIRQYVESGKGEEVARLIPKTAPTKKSSVTLKLDDTQRDTLLKAQKDLKTKTHEQTLVASVNRYETVKASLTELQQANKDLIADNAAKDAIILELKAKLAKQSKVDTGRKPNASRKRTRKPKNTTPTIKS